MIFTFKNSTDWLHLIKVASTDEEYLEAIKTDLEIAKKMVENKVMVCHNIKMAESRGLEPRRGFPR